MQKLQISQLHKGYEMLKEAQKTTTYFELGAVLDKYHIYGYEWLQFLTEDKKISLEIFNPDNYNGEREKIMRIIEDFKNTLLLNALNN